MSMRENKAYWIGGTVTALLGVGAVRLLAPTLAGSSHTAVVVAGYLLVIVGITILARATKKKDSPAFITVENEAKD